MDTKKLKQFAGWVILTKRGNIATSHGKPFVFTSRQDALFNVDPDENIVLTTLYIEVPKVPNRKRR